MQNPSGDLCEFREAIDFGSAPSARHSSAPLMSDLSVTVYQEQRRLSQHRVESERNGRTLQATPLVPEALLRIGALEPGRALPGNRRQVFLAAAMRRILIDRARPKRSQHGGGGRVRLDLSALLPADVEAVDHSAERNLEHLDAALRRLEAESPERATVVQLRFFGGYPLPQSGRDTEDLAGHRRAALGRRQGLAGSGTDPVRREARLKL